MLTRDNWEEVQDKAEYDIIEKKKKKKKIKSSTVLWKEEKKNKAWWWEQVNEAAEANLRNY